MLTASLMNFIHISFFYQLNKEIKLIVPTIRRINWIKSTTAEGNLSCLSSDTTGISTENNSCRMIAIPEGQNDVPEVENIVSFQPVLCSEMPMIHLCGSKICSSEMRTIWTVKLPGSLFDPVYKFVTTSGEFIGKMVLVEN